MSIAATDRLRADVQYTGGGSRAGLAAGPGDVPTCSPGKIYNNGSDSDGGGRGGSSSAQQSSLYKCSTMDRRRTPHFHDHLHHRVGSDFASGGGSILGIATMRSGQFSNGGGASAANELAVMMQAPQMVPVPCSSSSTGNKNNNNNNNNNHVPILNSILTTTIAAQALQSSGGVSVVGDQASRSISNNNNTGTANLVGGPGNGTSTLKKRVQIQEVTV